jgi:hypothetical protein
METFFQRPHPTPGNHQTRSDLEDALEDPAWHKGVFVRDPLERFLSGYRSKCEPGHDGDTRHCMSAFGSHNASFVRASPTHTTCTHRASHVRTRPFAFNWHHGAGTHLQQTRAATVSSVYWKSPYSGIGRLPVAMGTKGQFCCGATCLP